MKWSGSQQTSGQKTHSFNQMPGRCTWCNILPVNEISLFIHGFATGAEMACRLETFLGDEICAINEAVVQTNTKKSEELGFSVFTG